MSTGLALYRKNLENVWKESGFEVGILTKGREIKVVFMGDKAVPQELKTSYRTYAPKGYAIRYYRARGYKKWVLSVRKMFQNLTIGKVLLGLCNIAALVGLASMIYVWFDVITHNLEPDGYEKMSDLTHWVFDRIKARVAR